MVLVPESEQWRYREGRREPSAPSDLWRQPGYDDSTWSVGRTPIGYGEDFVATELSDMRGGYTTVYLRRTFEATGLAALDSLGLEVMYDDGVVVWINDRPVYQDNVASAELPYDAVADSSLENTDFVRYDLGDPAALLVEGTNVIAVQVLNRSIDSSSDCFIDVRLTGRLVQEPADETPVVEDTGSGQGKYEINAIWESEELTEFNAEMAIPAAVAQPGRSYRVRCRHKDTTGRWSHWSAPVQFAAGARSAGGVGSDLQITELMYNPPEMAADEFGDNDEYEFIELKNIGSEVLDLGGVSLTDGVTFDFADGRITHLEPGQFVLVVRNEAAFVSRYGTDLTPLIAGEYAGKLANEGERLALADVEAGTLAEFQYSDDTDWPINADGAGYSLVLLEGAGALSDGRSWRASTYLGGSPGADDPESEAAGALWTGVSPR